MWKPLQTTGPATTGAEAEMAVTRLKGGAMYLYGLRGGALEAPRKQKTAVLLLAGALAQAAGAETLLDSAGAGLGLHPIQSAASLLHARDWEEAQAGSTRQWRGVSVDTLGPKKVLIIRVDFSDRPGDPELPGDPEHRRCTAAYVQQVMDTEVAPYYERSSYGLTTLSSTVTAQLYRMPLPATRYAVRWDELLQAQAEAAASADYALADYDRIVVLFPSITDIPESQVKYGGQCRICGTHILVNGEFDFRVVAHELGHSYGLYDASLWQVRDANPISEDGKSVEYGDPFDTMGNSANEECTDFNPWYKYQLHWIGEAQVQHVVTSGRYRVNRFDSPTATGTLVLTVTRDESRDYWISCRRNFNNNPSMRHGAYIVWAYRDRQISDLLDLTTPGSDPSDAALGPGASLIDPKAGVVISPVAEGGVPPNEYVDVEINFGQVRPIVTAPPEGQTAVQGQSAVFTVHGNGIPPASFQWERQAAGGSSWVTLGDGAAFSGCTTHTLVASGITDVMDGDQFRCVLSNVVGVTISPSARLTLVTSGVLTVVGQAGVQGCADGVGRLARFCLPQGLALDAAGNLYVADCANCVIRKLTAAGAVSTVAGLAGSFGAADGTGSQALFLSPCGIAVDAAGNLYVTDAGNHTIRRITPNGVVTTVAGLAGHPGSADGAGDQARFFAPSGIALDSQGNVYVADQLNHTIRKITPEGIVSTLAGRAGERGAVDGDGSAARFNEPLGLATDLAGNIYVADYGFSTIRKITPAGVVSTLAGWAAAVGSADGIGSQARFNFPTGVAVDRRGNLFVADQGNSTIRQITPAGVVSTMAGLALNVGSIDGLGAKARFNRPFAVAVDREGKIYISDTDNSTIRLLQIAPAAPLELQTTRFTEGVVISWPAWANEFVLETSIDCSPGSFWAPVTQEVVQGQGNSRIVLTNKAQAASGFYRLQRQPAN